ncbi:AAA family ATPase [Vibrio diabolicus]|uniref:AAA family ATPase n=1 Tax=Vibrio diabolicus TaxID=50719 RepID=UPI00215FF245|nr:AAA family ATPase [Vibrio diabolicus]MCR9566541.1 AAA family ATPase [Vibrio alginolyticus]MCS0338551.1 AAA family ATPase [Vibrio diabolicus]
MNNRVIFTGGPGSGKTSVIKLLCRMGYQSAPEVGRKVIQAQVKSQGSALPWLDKTAFRDEMVLEEINNYENFGDTEITLYARSIIDSYGYSKLERIPISELLLAKCGEFDYCRKVFIFPPWEEIYENDTERKQDFNEAVATYNEMVSAYTEFGYDLIEVPKASVKERAQFIVSKLSDG